MNTVTRLEVFASRPIGAGLAFGTSVFLYTAAYVQFVNPRGLFFVPAVVLISSATVAAVCAGWLVWRYLLPISVARSYRSHALLGMVVGALTLLLAPPLALFGMTIPSLFQERVSLITPILIAGYLINAIAWGLVGTVVAFALTVGTPILVTAATGLGLGYLRRRDDGPPREPGVGSQT
ncbi:hypothetical protein [Haloarcula halophila]|uniref:hypothetical protein n=1 Tax=Haloarcula TaxID=2237 RepID=UPI0023E456EB|nr:hypothetical protein [Halomicroarcula sp. DFY41]